VAVMVVPCLPAGERVELLADCGERDVIAVRLTARPAPLSACMPLTGRR
jgi:hypothetical protein